MSATTAATAVHDVERPAKSAADAFTGEDCSAGKKLGLPQLTRNEVAHLISLGHVLVLRRRSIYRLNSWLEKHPGGHLAILHFVGRDAANEIEAYHSEATLSGLMRSFVIGQIDAQDFSEHGSEAVGWKPLVPLVQLERQDSAFASLATYKSLKGSWKDDLDSFRHSYGASPVPRRLVCLSELEPPSPPGDIDARHQYKVSRAWEDLHESMKTGGAYSAQPLSRYRFDVARYIGLFAAFLYVFVHANSTWHYYAAAVLLGACWHQVTFVVHDAGHTEVFGSYHADRLLGTLVASWFGGLSVDWWCDNHNIHHLVTNHPEHDPDIQHIPFFAVTSRFFGNLHSTYYQRTIRFDRVARFFVPLQHRLYYIVMAFARFNLFAMSYVYIFTKAKPGLYRNLEMAGVAFFWLWFGGGVLRSIPGFATRLGFLLVCFAVTSPLHIQITLSHFAQSTDDLGLYESFPARQLRTTMDVNCPEWIEFIHGGLHMQVTHHLFPRIPRHNLRKASLLVREFARQQGLEYHTYHFIEGNGRVLDVLKGVANQVHLLGKVAGAQARGELDHH